MAGLSFHDVEGLLSRLGDMEDEIVLVGGQALNFWAERYRPAVPELQGPPYTSKGLDFCGGPKAVVECARRLRGRYTLADPFEAGPNTGVVVFVDEHGVEYHIDFLKAPFGVDARELFALRVPLRLRSHGASQARLSVMHPVHCLEARAANTAELPGYTSKSALRQLRAAVICAREFSREILGAGKARDVLNLNERIFRFALRDRRAKAVLDRHEIDPADAILVDNRLPENFQTIRYPQMQTHLDRRRLP